MRVALEDCMEIDLELVVQRVLKVAEIAMLEHLEALKRSQANGLVVQDVVRSLSLGGRIASSGTTTRYDRASSGERADQWV